VGVRSRWRCGKKISARARLRGAGPLNVNLGPPPYYLGNYWS